MSRVLRELHGQEWLNKLDAVVGGKCEENLPIVDCNQSRFLSVIGASVCMNDEASRYSGIRPDKSGFHCCRALIDGYMVDLYGFEERVLPISRLFTSRGLFEMTEIFVRDDADRLQTRRRLLTTFPDMFSVFLIQAPVVGVQMQAYRLGIVGE